MKQALESLYADLLAAGVDSRESRSVRRSYAIALQRNRVADWVAFYRAVFATLMSAANPTADAESATRRAARTSLQLLLEDDLGSTLFSTTELANLRRAWHAAAPKPREPFVLTFSGQPAL